MNNKFKFLLVLFTLLLNSCYVYKTDYSWYKIDYYTENIKYIQVENSDSTCRKLGVSESILYRVIACTVRKENLCEIYSEYSEENIPEVIKEHEEKHCKGWSHN